MRKTMIAVLTVLLLGTAACSGKYKPGSDTAAADQGTQTGAAGETGATADCVDQTGGDATITISGFAYDVTCLKVSASNGITIVNEDPSAHSFSVEGGIVDEVVDSGQTAKVKSLSDLAPGTYSFNCRFHPPMVGTLIVE
ncbi:MAG TPA: cupredoxin domain-containing protein [Actinomycetota bacterium]|nr:cupredoxin domain-containing protein [Actinomycetota bacterium]